MWMIGEFSLQNMKKGRSKKIEVVYNVKYKFKTNENRTKDEIKNIFNNKLLNIIMTLENHELHLKNPKYEI